MKKIFLGLVFSFLFVTPVFASGPLTAISHTQYSVNSRITNGEYLTVYRTDLSSIVFSVSHLNLQTNPYVATTTNSYFETPYNKLYYIFSSVPCFGVSYNTCLTDGVDGRIIAQHSYAWTYTSAQTGFAIFGGVSSSNGHAPMTPTVFRSALTADAGNTMDGNGPIIATIIGILIAFIFAPRIIGIFRNVNNKSDYWVQTRQGNGKYYKRDSDTFGGY